MTKSIHIQVLIFFTRTFSPLFTPIVSVFTIQQVLHLSTSELLRRTSGLSLSDLLEMRLTVAAHILPNTSFHVDLQKNSPGERLSLGCKAMKTLTLA